MSVLISVNSVFLLKEEFLGRVRVRIPVHSRVFILVGGLTDSTLKEFSEMIFKLIVLEGKM